MQNRNIILLDGRQHLWSSVNIEIEGKGTRNYWFPWLISHQECVHFRVLPNYAKLFQYLVSVRLRHLLNGKRTMILICFPFGRPSQWWQRLVHWNVTLSSGHFWFIDRNGNICNSHPGRLTFTGFRTAQPKIRLQFPLGVDTLPRQ